MTPSPNLLASILARQTKRCGIAVIGNALPCYDPPTRVAEELAVIDCISGGRLIAGLAVGGGPEYYSLSQNPTFAGEKFGEAFDLILRAWTEAGPFEHYGEYWKLKCVNPWPRPIQQPHPPIWIPATGTKETIEFAAKRRVNYLGAPYFHIDFLQKDFDAFRRACEKHGYAASREQLAWQLPIYVAETDEQAWREYEDHLWYFAHKLLKGLVALPPGYASARSMAGVNKALTKFLQTAQTRAEVEDGAYAVVGSPASVRQRLAEHCQRLGVGNLLGLFQLGTLPHELTCRSLRLFAEEVAPRLREDLSAPSTGDSASDSPSDPPAP
ncbi:MAG: LLM class flavin-dependent oxidoreductase, partial [Pirellulaceae bacterium]|jgi:alkanesulfonate monooxygenase SsuD/methylene tetrahydromethanopterin reductase-like flavin-dependent oxidoreductase (luciferase family)|nr:LLM class flavin-dependent oxidoreductase [Pirellulaceae bacterium]